MNIVEVSEIFRRAHARGEEPEVYDPNQLVLDVAELLRYRGLSPDYSGRLGMATGAAGMMLRAFGIVPGGDDEVRDRRNAPDPDER